MILCALSMDHTNYGEARQLFETFTRVWEAGGKTSLHLHTEQGQVRATLDIQLGPPADHHPGAPEVQRQGPGPSHGPQHHPQPHQRRPRRREPASRARDEVRREAWLQQRGRKEQPAPDGVEKSDTEILVSNDVVIVSDKTLESSCVDAIETLQEILFSCELCEFVGKSTVEFKMQKNKKHDKNSPTRWR